MKKAKKQKEKLIKIVVYLKPALWGNVHLLALNKKMTISSMVNEALEEKIQKEGMDPNKVITLDDLLLNLYR